MGRYIGPKLKLYKRERVNLYLKNRFFKRSKIKVIRKKFFSDKIPTHYAIQLREKQKLKIIYGVLEKQFKRYYVKAKKMKGNISMNIINLLESRLDNIIYRMGFSSTRSEARQMVNHKFFLLNKKKVNIPSIKVNIGDIIQLKYKYINNKKIFFQRFRKFKANWVFVDFNNFTGYLKRLPFRDEVLINVDENLVLDLCAK